MTESVYQTRFIGSIEQVEAKQWDTLFDSNYPFVKHAFLHSLETTGCTTDESGWSPCHCLVEHNGRLIGAWILFQKTHSYGEYVFDHSWADAYYRHGFEYYPKLVSAIPFTPATGPRLAACQESDVQSVLSVMSQAIHAFMTESNISSAHLLFPDKHSQALIAHSHDALNWHKRAGCQFHWFNHDFADFDSFLATFSSRKRKNIKKERQKVHQMGLDITVKQACDIQAEHWQVFYALYNHTYLKRSGRYGYLTENFFQNLSQHLGHHVAMCQVWRGEKMIAAALYFYDDATLYGRYWGAMEEIQGLHFEACYYQGIEFAIKKGLTRFDPGAQGEHKIQRGFTPIQTTSLHAIMHPDFEKAIADFVLQEHTHTQSYIDDARTYLPFKEGHPLKEITNISG